MTDTIAAISTGGGISAIGIVRLSGTKAIDAADAVFRSKNGISLLNAEDRKLYYGSLLDADGNVIDLCLCTISRAPHSYTGEDTAEFQCHGSPVILTECLNALFAQGVRSAGAGEFTKRAFLNGCMDLTQAEAVIDLIEAETTDSVKNAVGQLAGAVRERLEGVYTELLDIIAHFHAVIDYPDEDIDEFKTEEYLAVLKKTETEMSRLLATYERGKILKNGVPSVIAGLPNAGKSSLLNALLGYERAIVTEIPGTTRDTIEEKIRFGSVTLRLTDTAGIRETSNIIEKLGVERSAAALSGADLVIIVLDGTKPLNNDDALLIESVPEKAELIAVLNKCDLPQVFNETEFYKKFQGLALCKVSAKTGEGITELETEIRKRFSNKQTTPRGEIITNSRQAGAINRAQSSVAAAYDAISSCVTPDAALCEVEAALSSIGEVTGKTMREDVTARVFERFCVGK